MCQLWALRALIRCTLISIPIAHGAQSHYFLLLRWLHTCLWQAFVMLTHVSRSLCACARTGRTTPPHARACAQAGARLGGNIQRLISDPACFPLRRINGKFEAESQRNNAIKKTDSYSQFPGERGTGCHVGHRRNPRAGHEAEGEQGPVGVTFYGGFCRKE